MRFVIMVDSRQSKSISLSRFFIEFNVTFSEFDERPVIIVVFAKNGFHLIFGGF